MTDHIRNEIAAWVDSEYGNCPVSASELLALIDAQATEIKQLRAELAKPKEASHTAMQLAAMVLSDCGISTVCTTLHERVARRIALHEEQLIDNLQKLAKRAIPAWHDAPTPTPATAPDAQLRKAVEILVTNADWRVAGMLSKESKLRDYPSNGVAHVRLRDLARLRDALKGTP